MNRRKRKMRQCPWFCSYYLTRPGQKPATSSTREEAERLRRVPQGLSDGLAAALYHMFLPHALGGLELPPLTVFNAVETVSAADGSVSQREPRPATQR